MRGTEVAPDGSKHDLFRLPVAKARPDESQATHVKTRIDCLTVEEPTFNGDLGLSESFSHMHAC